MTIASASRRATSGSLIFAIKFSAERQRCFGVQGHDAASVQHTASAAGIEGEPILSEEERTELLAIESTAEQTESQPSEDIQAPEVETGGTQEERVEETEPEIEAESHPENESGDFYSELTKEEVDVLSVSGIERKESDKDLEHETKDVIDYSEILDEASPMQDIEESREVDLKETEEAVGEKRDVPSDDSGDVYDISPPVSEEKTPDETENVLTEEETGIIDSAVSQEMPVSETPLSETPEDSLRIVEELVKKAPDIEFPIPEEKEADISDLSLDELITDYEHFLEDNSEISRIKESLDDREEDTTGSFSVESLEAGEDVTATMAEIYVSQGLILRAVDIYDALLKREPDNKEVKSRLEELRKMSDQQSDES